METLAYHPLQFCVGPGLRLGDGLLQPVSLKIDGPMSVAEIRLDLAMG
jgi:hypothetical protein